MKLPAWLLAFFGDLLWNMLMLVFGVGLYIASAANVGLDVPAFVNESMLIAFSVLITVVQTLTHLAASFPTKKEPHATTLPLDHHPRA